MVWILVAFLGNGFAQFFQKYLHVLNLGAYQAAALVLMYAVGLVLALVLLVINRGRISPQAIRAGAVTALASYLGNFAVLRALSDLPSHIVFPLVVGGPILLVALWQRTFENLPLSPRKIAGIVLGFAAVVLLTTAR